MSPISKGSAKTQNCIYNACTVIAFRSTILVDQKRGKALSTMRKSTKYQKPQKGPTLNEEEKYKRLVELNVQEQCINVIKTAEVQYAYRDRNIKVHGWVFDIHSGKLIDLEIDFDGVEVKQWHTEFVGGGDGDST